MPCRTRRCAEACTVAQLLEAIQSAIRSAAGGQTGTVTSKEWNAELAQLLVNSPYEEEFTKSCKKALEAGGEVCPSRCPPQPACGKASHQVPLCFNPSQPPVPPSSSAPSSGVHVMWQVTIERTSDEKSNKGLKVTIQAGNRTTTETASWSSKQVGASPHGRSTDPTDPTDPTGHTGHTGHTDSTGHAVLIWQGSVCTAETASFEGQQLLPEAQVGT